MHTLPYEGHLNDIHFLGHWSKMGWWGVASKRNRERSIIWNVRSPHRWTPISSLQYSSPVGKCLLGQWVKTHPKAEEKQTTCLNSERSQCMRSVRSLPAEMTCPVHDQLFTFPDASKPYIWKTRRQAEIRLDLMVFYGQGVLKWNLLFFFKCIPPMLFGHNKDSILSDAEDKFPHVMAANPVACVNLWISKERLRILGLLLAIRLDLIILPEFPLGPGGFLWG